MYGGKVGMDEFRDTYLRLCRENHVEPQDTVIEALAACQRSTGKPGGACLNLSAHSLTVKTCAVLAKVLATDRTFNELKFNDCMIPEEGVKALAHGLASNVACRKLDIKGNNIRGTATEGLGRMLRQNKTLLSMCLEWNAMGMLDTSLSVFCEGLGSNTALQVLDLRNNQISHDGATEVAAALKRNTTLRALDLRWNNLGLLGGRALLTALDFNKTIVKLEMAGNNTPTDILRSIDTAVSHNADRSSLTNDYLTRQQMLSQELQQVKKNKHHEMADLMDKMDRQESAMKRTSRSAIERVNMLQDALEERKEQFNTLAAKLSLTESELTLSESRAREFGALLTRAKDDQGEMAKIHHTEVKREREDRVLSEGKLHKELIEINDKNLQLENKLDESERRCRSLQEQTFELKDQLTQSHAEGKLKGSQFDEKIQFEKQKSKDAYRDAENMKLKEVERVKKDAEEVEKSLKDRIQKLEMLRIELEEEVSRQKSNMAGERLQAEEQMMNAKQRLKNDEEQRCRQLDEKIRLLQSSKDDLEKHVSQQSSSVADLQSKNANLVLENETLRRRIDDLNQDIAGKNSDIMAEVGKVRIELNQKISRMESERMTQSELYDKISKLDKELAELSSKHRNSTEEKDHAISELKEKLKSREAEIKQMQQSDMQRSALLQTAIQNYVTKAPFSSS